MVRAARHGEGWFPYFYSPDRYHDSVEKTLGFAAEIGRDLAGFQWAFFSYISIYPTVEEAEAVSARILGSQYLYGGDFSDIVRRYCILGPVDRCIARLQEYVDAGVRYFIFNFSCPKEERSRHLETVAREVIPGLRESAGLA